MFVIPDSSGHYRSSLLGPMVVALGLAIACILALIAAVDCHTYVSRVDRLIPFTPSLLYGAALWVYWLPVWLLLWFWIERLPRTTVHFVIATALSALAGLAFSILHLEVVWRTTLLLENIWPRLWEDGYRFLPPPSSARLAPELLIYAVLWAAGAGLRTHLDSARNVLEAARLRGDLAEARLSALQRQMEPHFVLNTMNVILGLLEEGDVGASLKMLTALSALTRDVLRRDVTSMIALKEEIGFVERYIDIQTARFGDRVSVRLEADPSALNVKVPPFLMQPLIENAVVHGVGCEGERCEIVATAWLDNGRLHLCVKNAGASSGTGNARIRGNGISLKNLTSRLDLLFGQDSTLEMQESENGCKVGLSFSVLDGR